MDHGTSHVSIGDSLPRESPRITVEAEALRMNRGRGRQLLALVAGAFLLAGVGFMLLQRIGRGDAYVKAAAATAQLEQQHFDGFFGCALPGTRTSDLDARRVSAALESLGNRFGKSYAKTLERCLPRMQALTESVQALQVPAAVMPQRAVLVTATHELTAANAHDPVQALGLLFIVSPLFGVARAAIRARARARAPIR